MAVYMDPSQYQRIKAIRAIAFDFDGVFTDNRVWISENGQESVACWRSDGLGIAHLRKLGIPMTIISTEKNPVVSARSAKLCITCVQGLDDKLDAFRQFADANGLSLEDVAFVGNDVNDQACLEAAGCAIVPADAHPLVKRTAHIVLKCPGGFGAVREICDLISEIQENIADGSIV
jgi:YrbI family 3-deoxy-D-manno-octulosonate 8-phosphate phosphatase